MVSCDGVGVGVWWLFWSHGALGFVVALEWGVSRSLKNAHASPVAKTSLARAAKWWISGTGSVF